MNMSKKERLIQLLQQSDTLSWKQIIVALYGAEKALALAKGALFLMFFSLVFGFIWYEFFSFDKSFEAEKHYANSMDKLHQSIIDIANSTIDKEDKKMASAFNHPDPNLQKILDDAAKVNPNAPIRQDESETLMEDIVHTGDAAKADTLSNDPSSVSLAKLIEEKRNQEIAKMSQQFEEANQTMQRQFIKDEIEMRNYTQQLFEAYQHNQPLPSPKEEGAP